MLEEAKLAVLCTLVLAPLLTWSALWLVKRLPTEVRARQIRGTAEDIPDLTDDVDPERDHIRGPEDAPVTLLEYGDFECPYCGQAEQTIRELLVAQGTDVRYVWRHLPLNDVHPFAQLAAEASEAAAAQGSFWEMSDTLLGHQGELGWSDLMRYAEELELDVGRFTLGSCATATTPTASSPTWPAPTRAGSPARPPSSSTDAATTASTTCRPSPKRSPPPSAGRSRSPRPEQPPTRQAPPERCASGRARPPSRAVRILVAAELPFAARGRGLRSATSAALWGIFKSTSKGAAMVFDGYRERNEAVSAGLVAGGRRRRTRTPTRGVRRLAPYAVPDTRRALLCLATSVLPYLGLTVALYLLLKDSALAVLLVIPAAAFLVRSFIVFHDCTHGSFFASRRVNLWLGRSIGLLLYAPFTRWRHDHAVHHASSGDLDRRGTGDVRMLTVAEYEALVHRERNVPTGWSATRWSCSGSGRSWR